MSSLTEEVYHPMQKFITEEFKSLPKEDRDKIVCLIEKISFKKKRLFN